jgi:uncharacterized membrane protein YhaH (DUF805 family)
MASAAESGTIETPDGRLFRYGLTDLAGPPPRQGAGVIFTLEGDFARHVEPIVDDETLIKEDRRNWLRFYLSPVGRIRRRDYWIYGIVPLALLRLVLQGAAIELAMLVLLATTWSLTALNIKRFHDVGYSGWWSLLPVFTVAIALTVPTLHSGASTAAETAAMVMLVVSAVLAVLWCFGVLVRSGQEAENRYGPPPLRHP